MMASAALLRANRRGRHGAENCGKGEADESDFHTAGRIGLAGGPAWTRTAQVVVALSRKEAFVVSRYFRLDWGQWVFMNSEIGLAPSPHLGTTCRATG
jgi:hypothetical protein